MAAALYDRTTIEEILPHRPPFLFVDRVVQLVSGRRIVAELDLRQDEPHFRGHFPGRPIMPGVLVSEAMAQTAGLLLALSARTGNPLTPETPRLMVLAAVNVKFLHPAVAGESLKLQANFERTVGPLSHLAVSANVGRREVAAGTVVLAALKEPA
jgi:3-hydroxymyristoyl/3-hydroxydecanoyl-(acyl carrier protein) dehydratase